MFKVLIVGCLFPLLSNSQIVSNGRDTMVNLYAFVGEKVLIDPYPEDSIKQRTLVFIDTLTNDTTWRVRLMTDNGFTARYRVHTWVFNRLVADTIEFQVFDHYGRPGFEQYPTVLLYLSFGSYGKLYHQKYQFDPVRQDSKGRWKGPRGESLNKLFEYRKNHVFKARGIF